MAKTRATKRKLSTARRATLHLSPRLHLKFRTTRTSDNSLISAFTRDRLPQARWFTTPLRESVSASADFFRCTRISAKTSRKLKQEISLQRLAFDSRRPETRFA